MTEPKTYTEEEVAAIVKVVRGREQITSALLTAIQRSRAAGDDEVYTNALISVFNQFIGTSAPAPTPPTEETKKPEDE